VDAMIMMAIAGWQSARHVRGSVAEIGVFYGRSFALLAKMLNAPEEKALAMDLFDIDMEVGAESGQLQAFKTMLIHNNISLDRCVIRVGDSASIAARDIVDLVGEVRIFSVDGGHERHHVDNDSMLALGSISGDGVIIFDDFLNAQYPDVTVAVLDFLQRNGGTVKAFGLSKNKLYVCKNNRYDDYISCVANANPLGAAVRSRFPFLGSEVIFWDQPLVNRAVYQTMAGMGLGKIANGVLQARQPRFKRG
jgi:hypothetical protein